MLNTRLKDALKVIEQEYCSLQKSTDRYVLMEDIQKELSAMKERKKNNSVDINGHNASLAQAQDKVLEIISSICLVEISVLKDSLYKEIGDLFNDNVLDALDWIETIMAIENEYRIEIPEHFEDYETTIFSLMYFVYSKM